MTTNAPTGVVAMIAAADIARRAGDMELARQTLDQAAELFVENVGVHLALGQVHLAQDSIEAAQASFRKVVELDPSNVKGWINLGAACGELDQGEEAERALRMAIEIDPTSREATSNLGVLRRESGRLDEAERLFRGVTEREPDFVFGHYNLAHCLFLAGRFEESTEEYRVGLKRDPEKTPNQNARLAWALLASGDAKAARRELKRALSRIDPAESDALREEGLEVLAAIEAAQPGLKADAAAIRRLLPPRESD